MSLDDPPSESTHIPFKPDGTDEVGNASVGSGYEGYEDVSLSTAEDGSSSCLLVLITPASVSLLLIIVVIK